MHNVHNIVHLTPPLLRPRWPPRRHPRLLRINPLICLKLVVHTARIATFLPSDLSTIIAAVSRSVAGAKTIWLDLIPIRQKR